MKKSCTTYSLCFIGLYGKKQEKVVLDPGLNKRQLSMEYVQLNDLLLLFHNKLNYYKKKVTLDKNKVTYHRSKFWFLYEFNTQTKQLDLYNI